MDAFSCTRDGTTCQVDAKDAHNFYLHDGENPGAMSCCTQKLHLFPRAA